jgi:hypothetical protein
MAALSEAAAAAVEDGWMHRLELRGGGAGAGAGGGADEEEGLLAEEFAAMLHSIAARPELPSPHDSQPPGIEPPTSPTPPTPLPPPPPQYPWSPADAAAVRAARAAAGRAEAAAAAVLAEERRARAAVTGAVGELLDARVGLAAATARSVAEVGLCTKSNAVHP